jgi:hypothetical protein
MNPQAKVRENSIMKSQCKHVCDTPKKSQLMLPSEAAAAVERQIKKSDQSIKSQRHQRYKDLRPTWFQ